MATTVWRGHLAFGLVSFPVRLYRAARAEKVSLRRLYRPAAKEKREPEREAVSIPVPARVAALTRQAPAEMERTEPAGRPVFRTHNTITSPTVEEPVKREELVKGFEYEKGRYVVLEDEELKSIRPETSQEMQIVEFVNLNEIDPIYFETSYYVAPDEAGARPYALLTAALKESGHVGVAQLAMHNREHIVLLRPGEMGLVAHTMFYPDEVRRDSEYRPDTSNLNPRELELAKKLIDAMMTPFEPGKFRDTYRDRLRQTIEAKMEGGRVWHEPEAAPKTGRVIDIMQALQESLNMTRKPAASAGPAKSAAPVKKAAGSHRRH